jgi:hypothetical protein
MSLTQEGTPCLERAEAAQSERLASVIGRVLATSEPGRRGPARRRDGDRDTGWAVGESEEASFVVVFWPRSHLNHASVSRAGNDATAAPS